MGWDLERGKRVGHLSCGLGTVVTVSDSSRLTVEFDSGITWHGIDREQFDAFYDPAEFERARRAAKEVQDLRELFEKASADPLPRRVSITPPPPGDDDWQLVRCWCTPSETSALDSEERRMLSARLAEKAVASFFLNGGHSVDDISIGQLSSAESDWRSPISGSGNDSSTSRTRGGPRRTQTATSAIVSQNLRKGDTWRRLKWRALFHTGSLLPR
jgi:hypothetical protein